MTKTEIESYRRRLLAVKKRLGAGMSCLEEEALRGIGGEASGGLSNVPVHPADLGTDNFEEGVTLGLLENEDQILTEIEEALARIEEGVFGLCENCQKEMSRQRLEALAYARYCVDCARKLQGGAKS